jgi:hypothetical protein
MKQALFALLLLAASSMVAAADHQSADEPDLSCTDMQRAQNLARAFLALVDDGMYEAAWKNGTTHYRSQQKQDEWLKLARELLAPGGKPEKRELLAFRTAQAAAPHQGSRLAMFDYQITHADGSRHAERLVVGALPADECGVVRYQIDARRLALTRLLDAFVSNLNRAGGRFDYSDASLIEIERVLMEHAPSGEPRAKQIKSADYRAFVHFLGQYVGELLVRRHNGTWSHTPRPENKGLPWVLMPGGRRIDPYQMVADYARQPAIDTLRQSFERELAAAAPRP